MARMRNGSMKGCGQSRLRLHGDVNRKKKGEKKKKKRVHREELSKGRNRQVREVTKEVMKKEEERTGHKVAQQSRSGCYLSRVRWLPVVWHKYSEYKTIK